MGIGRPILSLLILLLSSFVPIEADLDTEPDLPFPDLFSHVPLLLESLADPLPVRFRPRIPPAKGFLLLPVELVLVGDCPGALLL
jgi:hypothetical protein